ncbi:MAG: PAS domain S-box protein [Candidatus Contendobacter sp.]|nr:PAS domain S-box protein [Candidatus Contendobacter sp.]
MSSARPLRLWLAPRIVLAGLVPLAVVATLVLGVLLPQLRADLEIRYQTLARAIAGQIEIHLLGAGRELRAIAQDLRDRGDQPPSSWFGPLDAHAGTGDVFAAIYITDSDDAVYAVGLPQAGRGQRGDLLELDLSKWTVLREARERNEAVWSETFLSAVTGRLAVTLAIPVAEHTLVGEIAIDRLSEFTGRSPAESGMVTMILDRQGQIIAHSQAALSGQQLSLAHLPMVREVLAGRFVTGDLTLDGQRFIGTPVNIPPLGWIVLVAQPRSEAFRPFLSTLWVLVAGALVALLLAVLVAWGLARGFARRIGRYAEQAHAIAGGHYDQPWPITRIQEFDNLAGDLERMSRAIRQRERDLATSEARFRSVIGNAPVVLFQFDGHGIFTFSEGKGLAGIGLVPGEAVGQSVFELYRDYPEVCEHARRALGGESVRFNARIGEVFLDVYANPVQDVDGSLQVMGVTVDITERQRAQEALHQEKRFTDTLIDGMPGIFYVFDERGQLIRWNKQLERYTGHDAETISRTNAIDFFHPDDKNEVALKIQETLLQGTAHVEGRLLTKDGGTVSFDLSGLRITIGDKTYLLGVGLDITERKQAEEILWQAKLVVENSPVMLFRWKAEEGWPVAFVSLNVKQLGYSPKKLLDGSLRFASLVYPEDLERVSHEVQEYSERGVDQFQQEYRIVAKDGSVHWVDDRTVIERNSQGEITHYQGIIIDITERKRVEETLRLTQFSVDRASDSILWVDDEGNLIYANDAACASMGYTREELLGMKVFDIDPDFTAEGFEAHKIELQRQGSMKFESRHRAKDGHLFPVEVTTNYLEYNGRFHGFAFDRDITERKQIEEALWQSRNLLRIVLDTIPVRVFWKDLDLRYLGCNRAFALDAGVNSSDEMVGRDDYQMGWREQADLYRNDDQQVLESGNPKLDYEEPQKTPDGRHIWLRTSKVPLRDVDGVVFGILGTYQDITERKQAEAQLRESEARFRRLAENAPDMIYRLSLPEGRYEYVSPVCQQLTGHAPEEFYQSPHLIQRIIHPDWRARFAEEWAQLMVGQALPTFEYQIVHPSGPSKWLRQRNVLVRDDQGQPRAIEGIISDITEHKLLEEQIKTSLREKEALLKEIHHRVKNNLQLISSLLDLQAGYVEDQSVRNQLRESRNRVKSMALIHERLYQIPNLAQINLADYAHDLVTHLIHAYATPERAITARVAVPTGEPVLGVESAVPCGLIINELVTNALKHAFATRRAGEIVISLGVADGQRTLRVRDDGIGFPPTVDFRHTPSLGLAIVMTLVKQLKGSIELRTEAGTEFVVAFPNPAATKVAEQSATATRALDPRG